MVTFLSVPLNLAFLPFLRSLSVLQKKKNIPLSKTQVAKLTDLAPLPLPGFRVHFNPHCRSPYFRL